MIITVHSETNDASGHAGIQREKESTANGFNE
jgi:hypothetical protein